MTEDIFEAVISWLLPLGAYGITRLMVRHGDRSYWSRHRLLYFMAEGQAVLFAAFVLNALFRTWLLFLPDPATRDFSILTILVIDVVVLGSLWLYWRTLPELPSFFGWRRPQPSVSSNTPRTEGDRIS